MRAVGDSNAARRCRAILLEQRDRSRDVSFTQLVRPAENLGSDPGYVQRGDLSGWAERVWWWLGSPGVPRRTERWLRRNGNGLRIHVSRCLEPVAAGKGFEPSPK